MTPLKLRSRKIPTETTDFSDLALTLNQKPVYFEYELRDVFSNQESEPVKCDLLL